MSLRLKINLIVGALTVAFLATVLGLQWRSMRESVREEVVAANRVAAQLLDRTAWGYAAQGTPAMLAFLHSMGRVRSNDITLLDGQGQVLYASPPSTYKAGRDAPDWFTDLVAPPPAEKSIAFPDGKLVIQANASRAVVDAWDDSVVLVGVALTALLLTQALVFWLVGRSTRPFGDIVAALKRLEDGRFDTALPPLAGREAQAIASAFNRMVGELKGRIEAERRAMRAEVALSENRDLTRWIDLQLERERHAIARELHDEFGQSVTAMRSMALSIAARSQGRDAQSESAARLIAEEASRLYDAMHGMIPRLAPLVLDNFGLAEALEDLTERNRRSQPGLQLTSQVDLDDAPLANDATLTLYRAAQEGITNALRHGKARRIELRVHGSIDDVRLTVRDDGLGLAPTTDGEVDRTSHYGLRWLRERVEGLGGRVSLQSEPTGGACLSVWLPAARARLAAAA